MRRPGIQEFKNPKHEILNPKQITNSKQFEELKN